MGGDGEDFDGFQVGSVDEEGAVLKINANAVNTFVLWFQQFQMQTGMTGIGLQKPDLFLEFVLQVMCGEIFMDIRVKREDRGHLK